MTLAEERRHNLNARLPVPDYGALHCKADKLVFLAFALLVGPICVVDTNTSASRALLYTVPAMRAGCVTFVYYVPEYFQQLVGPSTTCDELCSVASEVASPRPVTNLAPRPACPLLVLWPAPAADQQSTGPASRWPPPASRPCLRLLAC
jgi:hypothetical protein